MAEEIIIDGVDVANCGYFCEADRECSICGMGTSGEDTFCRYCKDNPNCYYKQLKSLEQELKWANDEEKYLKDCCIKAGKELEKYSFKWDGKEKNLVVQALQLNQQYDELKQENENLKKEVKQIGSAFIKKGDYARELEKENKDLKEKYTHVLELAKTNADSNEYCLQELEKENKELKEYKIEHKYSNVEYRQERESVIQLSYYRNKYRSALEEIQKVIKSYDLTVDNGASVDTLYTIRNIINEVLGNESK